MCYPFNFEAMRQAIDKDKRRYFNSSMPDARQTKKPDSGD